MYFKITFSNGYLGCDEEIYEQFETIEEAEQYAEEYLTYGNYSWYDDPPYGCLNDMEDYENEEDYWAEYEEYQAGCSYYVEEITKEEYEENASLD